MSWQLAQLNIAEWAVAPDGPVAAEFHAQLDEVNERADKTRGSVWRLQDDSGNATDIDSPFGNGWIVNLTFWEDGDALRAFTYRDARHAEVMRDRRKWFVPPTEPTTVLWWVPVGHRPTVAEAAAKLAELRSDGPTAAAFTFREPHPPPS